MLIDIKVSKAQLTKILQLGGLLCVFLAKLAGL